MNPGPTRAVGGSSPSSSPRPCSGGAASVPQKTARPGPNFPKISHDIKVTSKSPLHSDQSLRGTEERVSRLCLCK